VSHVDLLGDSVFDNGAYVERDRPDVAGQVWSQFPGCPEVTLLATDGHYISDVPRQMERLPGSATQLFLSVGGNDGLRYLDYANPIEPAAHGGKKIARAIAEVLSSHDFETSRAEIYT
jgi:hypothetical protein